MGGGGLYSTGRDYLRFLRMLLGDGELDGAQHPAARDRRGDGPEPDRRPHGQACSRPRSPTCSNDAEFFPGMVKKWGLAYMINAEDAPDRPQRRQPGLGGPGQHLLLARPQPSASPGVILTQILPFADPAVLDLFGQFERAIYAGRSG